MQIFALFLLSKLFFFSLAIFSGLFNLSYGCYYYVSRKQRTVNRDLESGEWWKIKNSKKYF